MNNCDGLDVEIEKLRTQGSQYKGHPRRLASDPTMYDRASSNLHILEPMRFLDMFLPNVVDTNPTVNVAQMFRMLDGKRVSERGKEQDLGENEANILALVSVDRIGLFGADLATEGRSASVLPIDAAKVSRQRRRIRTEISPSMR